MASYRDDYITWAEFEAKQRNGIPYEGFVIGWNNNFPMDATHHQLI
jgi:hypothetical protein